MNNWLDILVWSTWIVFLLKTVLVIAAGGLLTSILANRPATTRYRIWSGVFLILAILPIVHFGFTGWTVPIPVKDVKTPALQNVSVSLVTGNSISTTLETTSYSAFTTSPGPGSKDGALLNGGTPSSANPHPVAKLLWAIWLTGTLFLFLRLVLGRIQAHRLFRHSVLLDDDGWSFVVRFVRRRLGLYQNTAVASHPQVPIPLTYGTTRPVVMLPKSASEWTIERRRIVLLHEFAHIRRRDDLARLAARIVAMLYWFNPLSWLVFRKFKMEQEKSCDERVIRSGIRPSDYASHLVELARGVASRGTFKPMAMAGAATLGMARKPELEGRLSEILNNFPHKETSMKFKIAGLFIGIAFGMLLVVQPVAKAMDLPPDPAVAAPAAPAKVAKVEKQAEPATPEKPAEAPKPPKAPKKEKVVCKKITTTVTGDGDGKVFIIKDGDKVKKFRVKTTGEDDDNVILLGDDGDKGHNVFVMKDFEKQYKTQMKAAMVELQKAMELLANKRMDLKSLNEKVARSLSQLKTNDPKIREQLKKTMAEVEAKLKVQMEKNEEAMAKLKGANQKLEEDMKHRQMKWVEKNHEMDAIRMEKLAKLEEMKARRIEVIVKSKEKAMKDRDLKLKEIEEELARKHDGKTMKWTVQMDDDVDVDHNVKILCDKGDNVFIKKGLNSDMKIKLKVGLKGLEKKDRKAIDKALKKFKKDLPKGVKLDSNRDPNEISMDINVPKGQKLSKAEEKGIQEGIDKLVNRIQEIKGGKKVKVRKFHIKTK